MKLQTKFILVIGILHLLALMLSFLIFRSDPEYFLLAEALLLVSAIISWQLYRQMIRPLRSIVEGIEAIKSKDFNVKFLKTGSYEMDQLIRVYNEMMDQLKTERTRQEQQHFFLEKLISTSPTGILILDFDNRIHQLNPKAAALLGVGPDDISNMPLQTIDIPLVREIGSLEMGESKTITTDGVHTYKVQRSHFIDRGFPRSFVMIEELTGEILAAEKKAYGKVIRMMAHEVNNTIGPVNSIIDTTLRTDSLWMPENDTLKHALEVALQRNQNLNLFMRRFADVVRLPPPDRSLIDLNQLLKDAASLLEMKAHETRITISFQFSEERFMLNADRQQLEQAILNILLNAIEAVERDGSIIISSDTGQGLVRISDSGSGISDEHTGQLFSPFFSTKKNGQGVGLTLVKEILLNHGFEFSLNGKSGMGSVFEIRTGL